MLDNAKPLKDRVERLSYHVTCQLEKDIDLTTFPTGDHHLRRPVWPVTAPSSQP